MVVHREKDRHILKYRKSLLLTCHNCFQTEPSTVPSQFLLSMSVDSRLSRIKEIRLGK